MTVTSEQAAAENWDGHDVYGECECDCRACGKTFGSHAKFSGALIALVSRKPCPKCGNHELARIGSEWEHMTLKAKDVGNVSQ